MFKSDQHNRFKTITIDKKFIQRPRNVQNNNVKNEKRQLLPRQQQFTKSSNIYDKEDDVLLSNNIDEYPEPGLLTRVGYNLGFLSQQKTDDVLINKIMLGKRELTNSKNKLEKEKGKILRQISTYEYELNRNMDDFTRDYNVGITPNRHIRQNIHKYKSLIQLNERQLHDLNMQIRLLDNNIYQCDNNIRSIKMNRNNQIIKKIQTVTNKNYDVDDAIDDTHEINYNNKQYNENNNVLYDTVNQINNNSSVSTRYNDIDDVNDIVDFINSNRKNDNINITNNKTVNDNFNTFDFDSININNNVKDDDSDDDDNCNALLN